jgi:2-polyprenyl-3-methyl-5-hydroxy-6-metoxy-1,4-benzoquinol methylase
MDHTARTPHTPVSGRYGEDVFSADPAEAERLAALAAASDPATISVLASLHVPSGGTCLELGAGTGSIALWIADNLGPRRVTATDLDTQILDRLRHPALRVARHDTRVDSFPPSSFDLIVARNLLGHLPDRDDILDRMISWLAPEGWILIEDTSFFPADSSSNPDLRLLAHAAATTMADIIGTDIQHWARS